MNVVKCTNGHFFDADSYSECPHCGASCSTTGMPQSKTESTSKKFKLFGHKGTNASATSTAQSGNSITTNNSYVPSTTGNSETMEITGTSTIQNVQQTESTKDHTLDYWQPATDAEIHSNANAAESVAIQPVQSVGTQAEVSQPAEEKKGATLLDTVRSASANSEGKTMSFFGQVNAANNVSGSTETAQRQPIAVSDPVVGWLVCVKGAHFGASFNIGSGKNSIGRNNENRIILSGDDSISRSKHALIVYEPKKRQFYLQPGDSSGLTYLNDEYITDSQKLNANDVIELGNSKFVFVPLCGENFTWEDYLKND